MQRAQPFRRFALLMQALVSFSDPVLRSLKLNELGGYTSRGKGRGGHSGKKWSTSSHRNMHIVDGKWCQIENGAREVARRQRQIARGIIHVV